MIIGLSGHKQSGKTTAARCIRNYLDSRHLLYTSVSFADPLKELVLKTLVPYSWGLSVQSMDREDVKNCELPCGLTIRKALQRVGTDMMRALYGDAWVNAYRHEVLGYGYNTIVTPDVRFPNEVECIHDLHGLVIRLTRSPLPDTHASETALDNYTGFDYIINNTNMTIPEQNLRTVEILDDLYNKGYFNV